MSDKKIITVDYKYQCVAVDHFSPDLKVGTLYDAYEDPAAAAHKLLNIIDNSGVAQLYPVEFFRTISSSATVKKVRKSKGRAVMNIYDYELGISEEV